jgi:hypothetical protein
VLYILLRHRSLHQGTVHHTLCPYTTLTSYTSPRYSTPYTMPIH